MHVTHFRKAATEFGRQFLVRKMRKVKTDYFELEANLDYIENLWPI